MFCKNCGKEFSSENKFCEFCGASVDNSTATEQVQATVAVEEIKYAGFWIRVAASILDSIIASAIAFVVTAIFSAIVAIDSLTVIIYYLITFGYFIILTYKKGATWGKMAVGIKVISENKEPLGIGKVILRETVGKIVSSLILGIGYLMAGFTEKKQALHDNIAGTYVVYKDPKSINRTWVVVLVLIAIPILIAIIGIFSAIVLVSLNSAKEKAKEAAFQIEASSAASTMLASCYENNLITIEDLGSPKYFDPNEAFENLTQDCTTGNAGNFSITIYGTDDIEAMNKATCTENGCEFE